jgi:hypothetical protein
VKRFLISACVGLAVPAFAASAASITQNLAIKVTAPQAPTAVSFSPAGPVNVSDTASPGTLIADIQITTTDGQAFGGTVSISSQSVSGMVSLSSSSLPSKVRVVNINSANDGPETVTVQACENGTCVSGTLGMNVTAPVIGGILPPDRDAGANWRMAGMLSVGGIPNRTTVCATVNPRGSGQDDTTNIQNAISACPLGQVVSLAAGTFIIAEGSYVLLNKGITLRGAGPGVTTLQRTNGAKLGSYIPGPNPSPMIIVGPQRYNNNVTAIALTADAAAGTNSVQAGDSTGFAVGQVVLLDEASGAGWQPDVLWTGKQIWASPDYRVVWQKHNPYYQYVDDFGSSDYPYNSGSAGCWFSECDRPTNEIKQISAISGNTITFDSPITISYRASHQAKLYRWQAPHTKNAGVENLTLSNGDDGNLKFDWAVNCWAKNVENTLWLGDGFDIDFSFRIQLEGIYVHNAVWPVNGGGGYAISIGHGSSEALIENSISALANKVMVARSAGAGSVVAYNYMDDGYINGQDSWVEIGLNASHMVGSHHVLFEGNYSFNIDSDQTHGNSIYHTFFRNYSSGYRRPFTALDGTHIDDTTGCCGVLRAGNTWTYWWVGLRRYRRHQRLPPHCDLAVGLYGHYPARV